MAGQDDGDGKSKPTNGEPNPEYDNFQRLLKGVLAVPKEKVDEKRREEKRERRAG